MDNVFNPSASIWETMKVNDFKDNNTIYLYEEVDRDSISIVSRQLRKACEYELKKKETERKPIKLRICSYGGEAYTMLGLISLMEHYIKQGIIIETYNDGFCCSAGAKILMCGSKGHRYGVKRGMTLIHQTQTGSGRVTLQEARNWMNDNEILWNEIKDLFRTYSTLTEQEIEDLTAKNLDVTYMNKVALEKGIIDILI